MAAAAEHAAAVEGEGEAEVALPVADEVDVAGAVEIKAASTR